MDKLVLNSISPIVLSIQCWNAFIALMEYEEKKIYDRLSTIRNSEDLIRMNAQLCLLRTLKQTKEITQSIRDQS